MLDRGLFVNSVDKLIEAHGAQLRALCGKPLQGTWVAWDEERDAWFPDEAVILRVGSDNLEIVCWKLDEIALTWNMIDVTATPAWLSQWDYGFRLSWRQDALPALRSVVGKTLTGISIIENLFQTVTTQDAVRPENVGKRHEAWLLNGLEFDLGQERLQVFNALDENGVTTEPPEGSDFRRTTL